jgi:hypothetical protein
MLGIEQLIANLGDSDPYISEIFSRGGCYKFYQFINAIYPSSEPMINLNKDHIVIKFNDVFYDISGVTKGEYFTLTDSDLGLVQIWSFAKSAFLSLGECAHCEEPILI